MKISVIGIPDFASGKHNIKDSRLDQVDSITKAKKKTYIQVEVVGEEAAIDADAILVAKDSSSDLILKDLEFVETRLCRDCLRYFLLYHDQYVFRFQVGLEKMAQRRRCNVIRQIGHNLVTASWFGQFGWQLRF